MDEYYLTHCGAWCPNLGSKLHPPDEEGRRAIRAIGCKIDQKPVRYFQECRNQDKRRRQDRGSR